MEKCDLLLQSPPTIVSFFELRKQTNQIYFLFRNRYNCIHNFSGPLTRNLKIRHQLAPNVLKLSLDFGESLHIFAGIGEIFSSLIELSIINQKIKYIDETDFNAMDHLKKLYLRGNQIEYLSKNIVWNLPDLKVLDLSDNKMHVGMFSFSPQFEVLMLQNNKISHLPARLFDRTPKLKEFMLRVIR